jgi:hypothetical protein
MSLPFTAEQFLAIFAAWNRATEPIHTINYLIGGALMILVMVGLPGAGRVVAFGLSLAWATMGLGYHLLFFSTINPAAPLFGALFLAQAILFAGAGITGKWLRFEGRLPWTLKSAAGLLLAVYGLAGYALASFLAGYAYPRVPLFATAPCPTVIFTLGLVLLTRPPAGWAIYAIPLAWSAIGGSAAVLLGVPQDYGLIAGGIVALLFLLTRSSAASGAKIQ